VVPLRLCSVSERAGLLASDVGYSLEQLGGSYTVGNPYDFGWALFYAAWGAAALHPSMADLTVPVPGPSGEMSIRRIAPLMAVRDVTEQRKLEHELTDRASHDSLTGLPNRVLFRDRVERALSATKR
jgi:predicted signal transduction protein with EAL and GGDEF domain